MKFLLGLAWVAVGLFLVDAGSGSQGAAASAERSVWAQSASPGARTPVLVELFTSEGCSSCPPADALLIQLHETQPVSGAEVIALEWHVDYWNYIGWRDPFSSAQSSARQSAYAASFGANGVYTPQMIVDGRTEFVGSAADRARQTIARSAAVAKPAVELGLAQASPASQLTVRIPALPNAAANDTPEVFLALTESGLRSNVSRGENAGRRLEHTGVVRDLLFLGRAQPAASPAFATETALKLDPTWQRTNLRAVVFVQERDSRRVLAAAQIPFASH